MTIVYAVSKGSYSDYSVLGIFSTEQNARKYMQAFPKSGYDEYNDIEEYDLDAAISEIDRGLTHFQVRMYRSGNVHEVSPSEYFCADTGTVHWYDRAFWNPPEPWANFYVWAGDSAAAIKIANERRIAALATETA